jgi:hypothetical protein
MTKKMTRLFPIIPGKRHRPHQGDFSKGMAIQANRHPAKNQRALDVEPVYRVPYAAMNPFRTEK